MSRKGRKTLNAGPESPSGDPASMYRHSGRPRAVAAALGLLALAGGFWLTRPNTRPPSLLLVTIDTLRADRVGVYGYGPPTTPHLDALAGRGVRFAFAQSASPLTGPSHATLLTGQYPPVHGVRDNVRFPLAPGVTTLAERLKRKGFETAAFVGAYPLAAAFGFGRGFDHFDEGLHPSGAMGGVAERPGNEVAAAAVQWLRARPRGRVLAWVHLFDPHEPYAPPDDYRGRFASAYDGEVAFADAQLGVLLDALRATGGLENTVVAVLADHGEGLGDHGESTHGLLLYESTLRIPFVIAGPGIPKSRAENGRVGTIDLVPTLLKLLDIERPEGLPGRDLTPAFEDRPLPKDPLYAESLYGRLNCGWAPLRGFTLGDWKLVDGGGVELFDLERDPAERENQVERDGERATQLADGLRRAMSAMAPGGDRVEPARLTPSQTEALRSLGYVASGSGSGSLDVPGLPDPRQRRAVFERLRALGGARGANLEPALQEAARIATAEASNPLAQEVLAGLAVQAGRLELAAQALGRFVELEPARVDARTRYGSVLLSLGKLEPAERELRRAVAEGGEAAAAARVGLAETLLARGQADEAEAILGPVLARNAHLLPALVARGRLRLVQGRTEDALADLQVAANAGDTDARLELGEIHANAGNVAALAAVAQQVLTSNPAHPWALALLGQARVLEGRREEGQALLGQALRAGPRRPIVWRRLAAGFDAAGQKALARRCRAAAAEGPVTAGARAPGG